MFNYRNRYCYVYLSVVLYRINLYDCFTELQIILLVINISVLWLIAC